MRMLFYRRKEIGEKGIRSAVSPETEVAKVEL